MARPATDAAPTFRIWRAATTGLPSPGPLTRAAMVAIDSAAIVHWLMPTTIVRRAIGSCTWRSIWPPGQPQRPGRLDCVVGETERMPCSVIRTMRRQRVDDGQHERARPSRCRRTARAAPGSRTPGSVCMTSRTGVTIVRHGLAAGHPDAEREADHHAEARRRARVMISVSMLSDHRPTTPKNSIESGDQDRRAQAGDGVGDPGRDRDHARASRSPGPAAASAGMAISSWKNSNERS